MTEIHPRRRRRANQLLSTKFMPTRIAAGLVSRPALLARLDQSMLSKLSLLSAPTGFGKTTLVVQWLATRREPTAWLALDPADNDPVRFWTYVITACRAFDPALGKPALSALRTSQALSDEVLVTSFINELAALPATCVLVLEDYHVITSAQIHAGMAFLLDHLPGALHLVLLTRTEPPLGLARLRAQDLVGELDATDLQFTRAETQAFLEQVLQVSPKPETVAHLDARTEGWAAGLRLVALAMQRRPDPASVDEFLASFSGGHRHVIEYLAGEVLAGQTEPLQEFLLQTGILTRLTASLCNAVTGRCDGARLLAQLERANLFLLPLGDDGGQAWYRYHALFAEAMRELARERFGEEGVQALYARASAWFEGQGLFDEAVEAALAARQPARAADLVGRSLDLRSRHELYTLRHWLEQIPLTVLEGHPNLCFEFAVALLFTSDRYAPATAALLETPLHLAEEGWRREGSDAGLGQVLALRALVALWQGDFERSFALMRESLPRLPEHEASWRSSDLIIAGIEESLAGSIETAQNVLIEARALSGAVQNLQGKLAATGLLADIYVRQGEFDQALELYGQVRAQATGSEDMLDDQAAAALGRSRIAYERNELDVADREAGRALDLGSSRSNEQVAVQAELMRARVLQARGQKAQAQEELRALLAHTRHPWYIQEVLAWQARLALAAGDVEAVHHWYVASVPSASDRPATLLEQQDLLAARMLIRDREVPAALQLLDRWQTDAERHGRTAGELEALALRALAYAAGSDPASAARALIRALIIARPKGFQRLFLDEGEPMRLLLTESASQLTGLALRLRAYAYQLLSAFSADQANTPAEAALPFEPLSPQERRVLRLLAAGLSNPEIARELIVSTNTIKTQLRSIYRKLNVSNRAQAGATARELKLL